MDHPTLFGHPASGHSYKVALALSLFGCPFTFRLVDIWTDRSARPGEWRKASRFGEAPVLLLNGEPLTQSNAILLRLSQTMAPLTWRTDRGLNAEWLFWEANRIGFSFPNYRVAIVEGSGVDAAVIEWLRARLLSDLGRLEQELADGGPYLTGGQPSVADLACAADLLLDDGAFDLTPWATVRGWLTALKALRGWRSPTDLMSKDGEVSAGF